MPSITILESLKLENGNLGAEFYHQAKMEALQKLNKFPDSISKYFSPIKETKISSEATINLDNVSEGFVSGFSTERVKSAKKIVSGGDIIISKLRPYLKEMAYIPDTIKQIPVSTEFIVLREKHSKNEMRFVLIPFMLSKYVQDILFWSQQGSNHPRFEERMLLELKMPDMPKNISLRIIKLVKDALNANRLSIELHKEAQILIIKKLHLENNSESDINKYGQVLLSQTNESNRLDAEYFDPRNRIENIAKFPLVPLSKITSKLSNGKTPASEEYTESGVSIIKVENLDDESGLVNSSNSFIPVDWAKKNPKAHTEKSDILMLCAAHHPSYVGKSNVLLDESEQLRCAVGELIIIRVKSSFRSEFISLYLNIPIVKKNIRRLIRGNTAHLYPSDLASLPVPDIKKEVQDEISEIVRKSHIESQKSKKLLFQAKKEIEEYIENS